MGMNDKGLLTYDRKIRKDAFYFYKANWSDEPTLYISARRYVDRTDAEVPVKVYTNQKDVTLYVNGKRIGKAKADALHRAEFPSVILREGENLIEVRSGKLVDSCTWNYKKEPARTLEVEAGRLDGSL
jgi:beta-galactosidase